MKSAQLLISSLFTIGVAFSSSAATSQASLPMDKRDMGKTQGRDAATAEWLQSWHAGEIYKTTAQFDFAGDMELDKTQNANWLQRRTVANLEVIEKGAFFGKAISSTLVYHNHPHLRLVRDWQYVSTFGTWGASVVPKSQIVQRAIAKSVQNDAFGRENRELFYKGIGMVAPGWGSILASIGEAGWEIAEDWFKQNIGEFDEEGRLVLGENTPIGRALGAEERRKIVEQAMAFSKNVNGKKVFIAQDGKYTRRVREVGDIVHADADPYASVETFDKEYLAQGKKEDETHPDIKALVKRESFSVTSELFDQEIRNPGDIWVVDAAFFNSFLHPDLKGAFSGTAVVKYECDEEGDEAYQSVQANAAGTTRAYDVRKISVLPHGKVNGTDVATDLKYDERPAGGRFSAKYDSSRSDIFVLVDKKSGHVVYSETTLVADEMEALPMLKLLEGFKASGSGNLTMRFQGDAFSREELSKAEH